MSAPVGFAHLPTPLEPMHALSDALGGPRLLVKRDDLTGLALGGNKARKLELLVAEAIARGADTLVTGGGPQSNHARLTAAAAARTGIGCDLALAGPAPRHTDGNLVLDRLFGARLHFTGAVHYDEIERSIDALAERLAADGRRPYAIPVGGASVTGVIAYARAVDELRDQLGAVGLARDPDWMVVADGSGGTHAGLLAGLGPDSPTRVLGVDVGTRPDLEDAVASLAHAAAEEDARPDPGAGAVLVDHAHVGSGYGRLSDAALDAIRTAARCEALVLDPVYTGKAMAALVTAVRDHTIGAGDTVVFWHTGGAPALFAHDYESRLHTI